MRPARPGCLRPGAIELYALRRRGRPATSRQGMIRRASIREARPRPGPRRPRRAGPRCRRAHEPRAARPAGRRASAAIATRSGRAPAGPDHGLRGHERREHRHQRHLVDPVLIERLHSAQVVQPLGREPRLLLEFPPRRVGRRLPGSMWPCTVSQDPGQRPPAARLSTRHSSALPGPRNTYRSMSETRTEVTAATARRHRAGRCPPAAISRDGTAHRTRCRGPTIVGKAPPIRARGQHVLLGQRGRVVAVDVVEELRRAVEDRGHHRMAARRRPSGRPAPSRRAAPAARYRSGGPRRAGCRARAPRAPRRSWRRRAAGPGRCP